MLATGAGSAPGVGLALGGSVINGPSGATGALIEGSEYGVSSLAGAQVTNYGTISATNNAPGAFGVYLTTGSISNLGTLSLIEGYAGAYIGTNGTVTNAGTIASTVGTSGVAVSFGSGNARLIVDPGAVFIGYATGCTGGTGVLELAPGAVAGTLSGLGTQFTEFATITVDASASWTLSGSNTLASGYTLTDSGTLTNTGSLLVDPPIYVTGNGTLINSNTINAPGTYTAVSVASGGVVSNTASGVITAGNDAITASGTVSITNFGTITASGTAASAVHLTGGGTVVNGSTSNTLALLEGYAGVFAQNSAASITNFGTIRANPTLDGVGVNLDAGGTLINGAVGSTAALIAGGRFGVNDNAGISTVANYGTITGTDVTVYLIGGGTVINAGTIIGGVSDAIVFGVGSTGHNELVLEHGYAISGQIVSIATSANSVELLGTSSANAVTADYNSLGLTNFSTIAFAPGAGNYATLKITDNAALPGTIAGFIGMHDTIDLTTLSDAENNASTSFNTLTNVLTVMGDGSSVNLQLDNENYTGLTWVAQSDGSGGTDVHPLGLAPPVISGAVANQSTPNQVPMTPFSSVSVTDPDLGTNDVATVSLSVPGYGTLSNLSGGSYNAATGVYTISGTAAAITAALNGLSFIPIAQPNVFVSTTSFALSVQSAGGTTKDSTSVTSVNQILGLAAIPLSQISISVAPNGTGFAAPINGNTNEAVVSAPVTSGSYVLPAGFQAMFLGGSANATLSDTAVGNALLVGNQGDDILIVGAVNDEAAAGSGNDTLLGGAGAATLVGGVGSTNLLAAGSGDTLLVAGSGLDTMFGGSGADIMVGGAGPSTVSSGTGATTVFAGTGAIEAFGGASRFQFVGGSNGASTVVGGSGNSTLFGGTGANNELVGGTGAATIVGGANGDELVGGDSAGNLIVAGTGNETLVGSFVGGADTLVGGTGSNLAVAGTGNDIMFGGSGPDTMLAGTGNDVMLAGSGPDVLVFSNGQAGGSDEIWNFTQGSDFVFLANYAPNVVQTALASAVTSGGSTTITLTDDTRITFGGITQLTASNFA